MEKENSSTAGNHMQGPTLLKDQECILNITLATNAAGWNTTVNGQLVIELAKNPRVKVCGLVPSSTQEQRDQAKKSNIELVNARKMIGYSKKDCLAYPPNSLDIDILIIHSYGLDLGRQAQAIKETKKCKWVHVVHTVSAELEQYVEKASSSAQMSECGSEHEVQLALCQEADIVIAIGPKVADAYKSALCFCGKHKDVINLTPQIVHDLVGIRPVYDDREVFRVMINATYPAKYFKVKGCDIAAKAITLQDASYMYHLIFVVLPDDNAEDLKTQLKDDIRLSRYTVKHVGRNTEDWRKLLCQVDLAILPSAEGFGTSGVRAISADLPVLISGNSGLGMTLKKLPSGGKHVVNSEDPQVWANKIKEVREKGSQTCRLESEKLRNEYMKKFNWKEQCDKLVDKMIEMFPSKQESKKECVEHTEEIYQVESMYYETRLEQGKVENTREQEQDVDKVKKGVQDMGLTEKEKIGSNMEMKNTLKQEGDKTSVEETGLSDKSLESGHDMVDAMPVQATSSRMLTNVMDIPYSIYSKVCLRLNLKNELTYQDFRMLGEVMGYDKDVTRNLEQRERNPTNELLKMWAGSNRQATVEKLIELLNNEDLERMDVVEILEAWVQKETKLK